MNSKRLTRMVISFVAIVGCITFVILAALNFDLPTSKVVSQLIGVVVLIIVIIGLSALTAFVIQKLTNRHDPDDDDY